MKLTKAEKSWVKKVNKILSECPSNKLTFYAMGDPSIFIVDGDHAEEIDSENGDPLRIAADSGWLADETISFPSNVSAVCG